MTPYSCILLRLVVPKPTKLALLIRGVQTSWLINEDKTDNTGLQKCKRLMRKAICYHAYANTVMSQDIFPPPTGTGLLYKANDLYTKWEKNRADVSNILVEGFTEYFFLIAFFSIKSLKSVLSNIFKFLVGIKDNSNDI